jgi:hypothetical protein
MTSQGRPYSQFQRALRTGNPRLALEAAGRLRQIGLDDALSLCLLLRGDPDHYDRAAVRWLIRYCQAQRNVGLAEAAVVLDAFRELADDCVGPAVGRLRAALEGRGLDRVSGRLPASTLPPEEDSRSGKMPA